MTTDPLDIRPMAGDDLALALDWAAAEGWNPGLHDAVPFATVDPQGLLVARLAGRPVATIAAIRYGDAYGFIGFYLVAPGDRGKGYGWAIWQAGMARLAGRNVGLDGVLAQQDAYRRSGFALAHRNVRYAGRAGAAPAAAPDRPAAPIVALATVPLDTLADYDRRFFFARRDTFLGRWIAQPGTMALGLAGPEGLAGYAVARACRDGHKIGPLFAETAAGADALYDALVARLPTGSAVYLDVPECHRAAVALAQRKGLRAGFETARMYTGPAPDLALDRTWGITSFELG